MLVACLTLSSVLTAEGQGVNAGAFLGSLGGALSGITGALHSHSDASTTSTTTIETTATTTKTMTTTSTTSTTTTITTTIPAQIEDGYSYPGNDLRRTNASSTSACLRACQDTHGCLAFSYEKLKQTCDLKGSKPRFTLTRVRDENSVSGVTGEGKDVLTIVAPPVRSSLYCWSLVRLDSYELDLLRIQYEDGTSIFGCNEYDILSNEVVEALPGVMTRLVNHSLVCALGGEANTAMNTPIFFAAWDRIFEDRRFWLHDWTVKVDPDSVFFASRLQFVVAEYQEEPQGVYISNCKYGLHGPLEVFSRMSVESWRLGRNRCSSHFWEMCGGDCHWGEDLFIDQCLKEVLHVKRLYEFSTMLVEDHCSPPAGWQSCQNGKVAALHPFKQPDEYRRCVQQANAAAEYVWTQNHGGDMTQQVSIETMGISDLEAVKRRVEERGYAGFVVQGDRALLKAYSAPKAAPSDAAGDYAPVYVFGPPEKGATTVTTHPTNLASTLTTRPLLRSKAWKDTQESASTVTETKTMTVTRTTTVTTTTTSTSTDTTTTTADLTTTTTATTSTIAPNVCTVTAHPVFSFWHEENREHTAHFGEAWQGEVKERVQFYAFPQMVPGSQPVYDFWKKSERRHMFHMGEELRDEERGSLQYYAFPSPATDVSAVYTFWQPSNQEFTLHLGSPWPGESRIGAQFYVPTGSVSLAGISRDQCNHCFEANIRYTPYMVGLPLDSALLCQQHCAATPTCRHFSYDLVRKSCGLADLMSRKEVGQSGMLAGPQYCEEESPTLATVRKDAALRVEQQPLPRLVAVAGQVWLIALAVFMLGLAAHQTRYCNADLLLTRVQRILVRPLTNRRAVRPAAQPQDLGGAEDVRSLLGPTL